MATTGKNIKITLKIVPQLSCSFFFFRFPNKEWSQKVIPVYHNNWHLYICEILKHLMCQISSVQEPLHITLAEQNGIFDVLRE